MEYLKPLVAFLCLGTTILRAAEPLPDGDEVFLIAINSRLLHDLVHKPISERRPLVETAGRVRIQGCIETKGTVTAGSLLSKEAFAFQLVLNSTTTIGSTNTTDGVKNPGEPGKSHPEIGAQFGTHLTTHATTTKGIWLREEGFALHDAVTGAVTSLDGVGGLRVQAQGLLPGRRFESGGGGAYRVAPNGQGALPIPGRAIFPRLRARMAPDQVMEGVAEARAKTETDTNNRAIKSLNEQFDKTAWASLLPIHKQFQTYFYTPFIQKKMLGGRLGAGSDGGWLALRGTRGDKLYPVEASGLPGLPTAGTDPVLVRFHSEFIERVAEMRFGGTLMTEVEAAEMMGYSPPDDETYENVMGQGKEEITFVFNPTAPMRVRFENDKIYLTLRFSEATTRDKTLEKVQITRAIEIVKGDRGRLLLSMHAPELPVHFDGTALPAELAKHLAHRFGRLLAKAPLEITKNPIFAQFQPMALKKLIALDNRLTAVLAPVEGGSR